MGFISELIGYPLGWIMWAVYALVKNYGVAILIFTFIVRLILFPLSVKQQKSTAAMAAFQPKLDKLKKQYANNPNKLQEEQMKLYAEENINPMASCLPMFYSCFSCTACSTLYIVPFITFSESASRALRLSRLLRLPCLRE